MKSKVLRVCCLLLAVLMLSTTFVACNDKGDDNTTQPTAKKKSALADAPVPHYDWDERAFKVLGVHGEYEDNFEIVGELDGDIVSTEVYNRNSEIEEYYNVKIVDVGQSGDNQLTLLENASNSDKHEYDLAFLFRNDMAKAIASGYMTELSGLQYLDFTQEWYNNSTVQSMKIGNYLFHLVSDFSLVDKARTNVLFFNRDMADDKGLDDMIQMARDKTWTIDKMIEFATQVATDDGDGVRTLEDDWGLTCGGKETAAVFWNGFGNKIVSFDNNGQWSIDVANDRSISSIEKLRRLYDKDISFYGNQFGDYSDGYNTFVAKKSLFMSNMLDTLQNLGSDADFAYCVLPYPMLNTEQGSYCTTNNNTYTATFGIPKSALEKDFSAFMIEVLSWRSHTTTYPMYYETMCKVRKSYDATCSEMVELVFTGLTFDFGLMYGSNIHLTTGVLLESIYTTQDITSLYATKKTAAENNVTQLYNTVETLVD